MRCAGHAASHPPLTPHPSPAQVLRPRGAPRPRAADAARRASRACPGRRRPGVGAPGLHVQHLGHRREPRRGHRPRRGRGLLGPLPALGGRRRERRLRRRPPGPGDRVPGRGPARRRRHRHAVPAVMGAGTLGRRARRPARQAGRRCRRHRLLGRGPRRRGRLPDPARGRPARLPSRRHPGRHQRRGRGRLPRTERGGRRIPAELVGLRRRRPAGHRDRGRHPGDADARMDPWPAELERRDRSLRPWPATGSSGTPAR